MEEYDGTNQMIQYLFSHPNEDGDNTGIYDESAEYCTRY
jgi:hypothetical protein